MPTKLFLQNYKVKPPCYDEKTGTDCLKRAVGCRKTCEAWKRYEEDFYKEQEEHFKYTMKKGDMISYKRNIIDKTIKKTRRRRTI